MTTCQVLLVPHSSKSARGERKNPLRLLTLAIVLITLGLGFLSSLPSLTRTRLGRVLLPDSLNLVVDVNKTADLSARFAAPVPVPVPSMGRLIAQPIRFPRNPGGGSGDEVFFHYLVKYGEATKLLIGINDNHDDEIGFWQMGAERLTIENGRVGIGDTSPLYLLTVGSGDLFGVNSSGYALLPAGTVGTPSLSFTADTNTGLWSSAADTLNLSTGGSERVRIDSSGNVGIGTTGPGARLHVAGGDFAVERGRRIGLRGDGGDATGEFIFSPSGTTDIRFVTANASRVTILGVNGNVGIGTTAPGTLLTLRKATAGNVLAIRNTGDTADTFVITDTGNIAAAAGTFTTLAANTSLAIGSGTAITKHVSVTAANVVAASIAAATCGDYASITTVTGAAVGDTVVASPTAVAGGIETVNLIWNAVVSAADTVKIRACNPTAAAIDAADTQTWRVDVWKH